MGKNAARRRPCDEGDSLETPRRRRPETLKQRQNDGTLKRRRSSKSAAQSDAVVQMLHDSFPRRQRLVHQDFCHDGEEQFADLSDIVATDWQQRVPLPGDDSDGESLYESRKLIMRQLVMNQLSHMRHHQQREVDDDEPDEQGRPSDADSWLEIEQSFAEIYEPLPFDVGMDSWRSMSKEEILQTVTSRRLRAELRYLSRAEILSQIQTIKIRHAKKRKGKKGKSKSSPVYEDMSGAATESILAQPSRQKQKKAKKVKVVSPEGEKKRHFETHTYQNTSQNTPALRGGPSLAEIYQAKVEARKRELRLQKEAELRSRATYVTRAEIHAPPDEGDGASSASSDRQGFISRASILSKWGTASTTPAETTKTKKELIEQFWRQSDYVSTGNVRSLNGQAKGDGVYKNPAAFSSSEGEEEEEGEECCPSDCEDCCDDDCSQCSCSSCASAGTVLNKEPHARSEQLETDRQQTVHTEPQIDGKGEEEKAPEPVPLSLVKQRKMEFERLRVLEEQESRLKELVKQQKKSSTSFSSPAGQSWLDIAKRAKQLEDKWYRARRTASSVVNPAQAIYEPVPPSQVFQSSGKKEERKKSSRKSRNRKRSKVLQQLRSRMRENLSSDLDPGARQKRHQELQELLSDALHAGTQTLSNINLGLIYVPMEEQLEREEANEKADDVSVRSSQGSRSTVVEQLPEEPPVQNDDQDNEDVFGSIDTLIFEPKANGSSTLRTDEIDEVEKKISREFEYLNDSQYGSCAEDTGTSERSRSSMSSTSLGASSTGSKNGRRAAAASATAMPRQQLRFGTEDPTGFCAAAASCDASAFNSTHSSSASLTSFESVIRRGQESMKRQPGVPTPPPLPPTLLVPPAESSDDLTPRRDARSSHMDSEAYTHVDTDASWDYYPDEGGLAVGNLRKRPSIETDEADETARLLESLRVAEETNASTSIRLIFPSDTRKQSVKDFIVLSEEAPSSGSRSPVQSPDSGFRSLPAQVPSAQPSAPKKRDTMMRELRSRLMDKFPCVGDDRDSSAPPSVRRPSGKKKAKVASKLESLLATFNALAEMKVDGRVYRVYQEPLVNDVDYESVNWAQQSTGYPQHLQNIYQRLHHADGYSEPASTVYNPSLPDEFLPAYHHAFEADPLIDCEATYPFDADEQSASDPLEERSSSSEPPSERARKQRRRRKKRTSSAWSDVENGIFADGLTEEEALLLQHRFASLSELPVANRQPQQPSRMAQYHDDWLFWDQMHSWCTSDADRERWERERARRMLLWMHHVQANRSAAGLPTPDWWQV